MYGEDINVYVDGREIGDDLEKKVKVEIERDKIKVYKVVRTVDDD
jgi:hypothetical protein